MRAMQTAFVDDQRIDQRLVAVDRIVPMQTAYGTRLILAQREPIASDWVDGEFVGDHTCPDEDVPHVHGEP